MYIMTVKTELIIPNWARWMAKDRNGEWWYHQNKPFPLGYYWVTGGGLDEFAYNDPLGDDDWEDSLTEIVRC